MKTDHIPKPRKKVPAVGARAERVVRPRRETAEPLGYLMPGQVRNLRDGAVDTVTLQRSPDEWAAIPVYEPDALAALRMESLDDLTAWLDSLGDRIHTYSLRGIALAAWEFARGANAGPNARGNAGTAAQRPE